MTDHLLLRVGAILAHALLNVFLLTYLTDYDLTGSWAASLGFFALLFLLLALFIRHLLSFIHFIKTRNK